MMSSAEAVQSEYARLPVSVMAVCGVFFVGIVIFSVLYSRSVKTTHELFAAGGRLPWPLVVASIIANWFAAENCQGMAHKVSVDGPFPTALEDPIGTALCLLLCAVLVAPCAGLGYTTYTGIVRKRFGDRVWMLHLLFLLPSGLFWCASQLNAFVTQLEFLLEGFNISHSLRSSGTRIMALVIPLLYVGVGGMYCDALFDLITLIISAPFILWMGWSAWWARHELGELFAAEAPPPPLRVPLPSLLMSFLAMEKLAIGSLGNLASEEVCGRVVVAGNPRRARVACIVAAAVFLVLGMAPLFVGYSSMGTVLAGDKSLFRVGWVMLPHWANVTLQAVLIFTLLNTLDSSLLSCGAILHDAMQRLASACDWKSLHRRLESCWMGRLSVLVCAVTSLLFLQLNKSTFHLSEMATSMSTAGVVPNAVFLVASDFGGQRSGMASLLTGQACYLLLTCWMDVSAPFMWSVLAATGAYVLFALV